VRYPAAVTVALLAAALPGAATIAQDATPTAGVVACTVEPRSRDDLVALWFGPDGTLPPASPVAAESGLPAGEPADAATVTAIDATIQQLFACSVAGQYARAFALMTDQAVRRFGPDLTDPEEDTAAEVRALLDAQLAATPVAAPALAPVAGVTAARDARVLPDGRVGAVFTDLDSGASAFLIFAREDGRWLLDEFVPILTADAGPAGTPTA
jgi:hypothetical protein